MKDTAHESQTGSLIPSSDLTWEELTGDNWRLSMGLFGTIIVFSDGWWQFIGRGDAYTQRKAESVSAAKQESVLLVRLALDNFIARLERL